MATKSADFVHWGSPDDFDVQNQNITSWLTAFVDILQAAPRRRNNQIVYPVRLIVHCYSRSTERAYDALEIASDMFTLLEHSCFPVTKSDDSTAIGEVQLYEGRLTNETPKFGETDKDIQLSMIVIDGNAIEF